LEEIEEKELLPEFVGIQAITIPHHKGKDLAVPLIREILREIGLIVLPNQREVRIKAIEELYKERAEWKNKIEK